jgi:hypothetical protein
MTQTERYFMTEPGVSAYPIPTAPVEDELRFRQYAVHINGNDYLLQQMQFRELPIDDVLGIPSCYAYEKSKERMVLYPIPADRYKVVLI